jgi:hypothetical protein
MIDARVFIRKFRFYAGILIFRLTELVKKVTFYLAGNRQQVDLGPL